VQPNERALLEAAQAGDRAALETLLSGYLSPIYRFGMKMCRDRHDAEDVVQETLLAASRSVEDFRGASSLSTWLYSIARRACLRRRRRGKHEPESFLPLDSPVHGGGLADDRIEAPDEEAARGELSRALQRAIERLEEDHREVLVLRDVQGLTAPEVAEVLGISVEAVKSRLHRARQAMRQELAPHLDGGRAAPRAPGCPDVLRLLSQKLEGEIDAHACAGMEEHLASCPHCRGECDGLKRTLALCSSHADEPVPAEVQAKVRAAVAAALGCRHAE
jgi:RNA polymerase sigma-70 factor, ECF subfamily